jgi:small subunit ribosomal protein S16
MVKIRLARYGKKRNPSYRIVVIDSRKRRNGKPIEEVGFYNPMQNQIHLNAESIKKRLMQGAQPTDVVKNILIKANLI